MVKVTDIKVNQSKPIVNNIGTTSQSNTQPVSTNNNTGSTWKQPEPLWKDIVSWYKNLVTVSNQLSPQNLAMQASKAVVGWLTSPEVKPVNAVEETAWWWNYGLDRAVSQQDNQQWHYNALNWTGHVVGMPEWPQWTVSIPQDKVWERMATRTGHDLNARTLWSSTPTETPTQTPTPVKTQSNTVQTNVSNAQNTTQPEEERIVNPDEFWWIRKWQEAWKEDSTYTNSVIQNMQNDLWQSTAWELYGKVTADKNQPVKTLEDANSVYASAVESRMTTMKSLLSQDPYNIAVSMSWWFNPYGDQAMRDLMQYAPERYKQIQDELKKIQAWENANAISTGTKWADVTWTATTTTNNSVDTWAESISTTPRQTSSVISNISTSMANNQVATTATQEMLNLNAQIAEIKDKLDPSRLEREANAMFKWDVPDYLVKAAMANKRQEYQSQLNKLESRYNSALDLYKTELSNAQWKEEMKLKYLQYQQWVSNDNWTRYYQSQQLKQNSIKWVDWKAYQVNGDWTFTQLTDATAYNNYRSDVNSALQWYMSIYTSWGATKTSNWYKYNVSGGQCETFTDNFTEATTGLRMTWEGGRWWTTAEEKVWYINSFVPEVWSVAVAVGWAYDSKYWHTMLVTGYDPSTWMVDLLWSNKDWDEMVYSTTASLNDLYNKWLQGFWNPYKDLVEQSVANWWNYIYSWFNTPMASAFERIAGDSSLSATQRNALPIAMEMYNTLYEIANNWQLDALVDSGDLALIMNDFKNKKFSNADRWEKFLDAFTKALNNKAARLAWWDDSYLALMALQRVIETKLRDESWAAISSSEWATNFSYLLPQAWEGDYVKQWKLDAWDRIISTKFIAAWGKLNEYVPIFDVSTVREIR